MFQNQCEKTNTIYVFSQIPIKKFVGFYFSLRDKTFSCSTKKYICHSISCEHKQYFISGFKKVGV